MKSPRGRDTRIAGIFRAVMVLFLSIAIISFGDGFGRTVIAATAPEQNIPKIPGSCNEWLLEADRCAVQIPNNLQKSAIFLRIARLMDRDTIGVIAPDVLDVLHAENNPHAKRSLTGALAQAQARAGMYKEAVKTAQMASNRFSGLSDPAPLDLVVAEQIEAGLYDLAAKTAETYKEPGGKIRAICMLARARAEAGQYEQAIKMAREFNRISAFIAVAEGLSAAGRSKECLKTFAEAEALAASMTDQSSDPFLHIAKSQAQLGLAEQACLNIRKITGYRDDRVLDAVIEALIDKGLFKDAADIARLKGYDLSKLKGLVLVGAGQARAGKIDDALATFNEAAALAEKIATCAGELAEIGKALAEVGMKKEAAEMIEKAIKKLPPEKAAHAVYYQANAGMYDKALATARKLDKNAKQRAISHIVSCQIKDGSLDEAEKTAAEVPSFEKHVSTNPYFLLARAWIEKGNLDKALANARKIKEPSTFARVLTNVACAYAIAGNRKVAAELFAEARLKDEEDAYSTMTFHGDSLLYNGKYAEACKIADVMLKPDELQEFAIVARAATGQLKLLEQQFKRIGNKSAATRAWFCVNVVAGLERAEQSAEKAAEKPAESKP